MREKESNDYDQLLGKLEYWMEELAKGGPRLLPSVQRGMRDYLELKIDEALWGPRIDKEPEPCIDFTHQQNYE